MISRGERMLNDSEKRFPSNELFGISWLIGIIGRIASTLHSLPEVEEALTTSPKTKKFHRATAVLADKARQLSTLMFNHVAHTAHTTDTQDPWVILGNPFITSALRGHFLGFYKVLALPERSKWYFWSIRWYSIIGSIFQTVGILQRSALESQPTGSALPEWIWVSWIWIFLHQFE